MADESSDKKTNAGLFIREHHENKPLRNSKSSAGFIVFLCLLNLLTAGVIILAAKLVSADNFVVCMRIVFLPLMCFSLSAMDSAITGKYNWIYAEVLIIALLSYLLFAAGSRGSHAIWILYIACGAAGFGFGTCIRVLAEKKREREKNGSQITK